MKYLFYCIFLVSLSGCMTVQQVKSGTEWDNNSLFLIKIGKTTAKEIAYGFGSPQKEIIGNNGRIWIYYNESGKYYFEGNVRRSLLKSEYYCLTVWFDKEGIVQNCDLFFRAHSTPYADKIIQSHEKGETIYQEE